MNLPKLKEILKKNGYVIAKELKKGKVYTVKDTKGVVFVAKVLETREVFDKVVKYTKIFQDA